MADLVDVATAKLHLHVVGTDRDADIALKVSQASAIVIDYLKTTASAAWTDADVPAPVQAATLIMLGHLYEHRGDDVAGTFRAPDQAVWDAMNLYLVRFRDPALA